MSSPFQYNPKKNYLILSIKDFPEKIQSQLIATLDVNGFVVDERNFRRILLNNIDKLFLDPAELKDLILGGHLLNTYRDGERSQLGLNFKNNTYKFTAETLPGRIESSRIQTLAIIGAEDACLILGYLTDKGDYLYAGKVRFLEREKLFSENQDDIIQEKNDTSWINPRKLKKVVKVKNTGLSIEIQDVISFQDDKIVRKGKSISALPRDPQIVGIFDVDNLFLDQLGFNQIPQARQFCDIPRIAIDFDNTIARTTNGVIEEILPGAMEALCKLKELGYEIVIHSVRANCPQGIAEIINWLDLHKCPYDEVWIGKPECNFYLDDKAISFNGDWDAVLDEVVARNAIEKQTRLVVETSAPGSKDFKFSSVQVAVPDEIADQILEWSLRNIPDSITYSDGDAHGRESYPHITILYGIHSSTANEVIKLLENEKPIKITLGKISLFERNEKPYDVIKIDIVSDDLQYLNEKINKGVEVTNTYPEYHPHLTLAYVKKGEGKPYIGNSDLEGIVFKVEELEFSSKDKKVGAIPIRLKAFKVNVAKIPFEVTLGFDNNLNLEGYHIQEEGGNSFFIPSTVPLPQYVLEDLIYKHRIERRITLGQIQKIVKDPTWQKLRESLSWRKEEILNSLRKLRQYLDGNPSDKKIKRVLNLLNAVARGGIITTEIKRMQERLRKKVNPLSSLEVKALNTPSLPGVMWGYSDPATNSLSPGAPLETLHPVHPWNQYDYYSLINDKKFPKNLLNLLIKDKSPISMDDEVEKEAAGMEQHFDKSHPLLKLVDEWKDKTNIKSEKYEDFLNIAKDWELVVTLKIDGEFTSCQYKDGKVELVSKVGRVRTDLPVTKEIQSLVSKYKEFIGFGELYAVDESGKMLPYPKAMSILRKPLSPEDENRIKFAVFDIKKLNNEFIDENNYWKRHQLIEEVFGKGKLVHPIVAIKGNEKVVEKMWKEEVKTGNYEGLVVHTPEDVYKIKPTFPQDVVVISVEVSDKHPNMIGALHVAYRDNDGNYRSAGAVGTGFSHEERKEWLSWAHKNKVKEEGNLVWVKPIRTIEVESKVLNIQKTPTYNEKLERVEDEVSAVGREPRFIRIREDKKNPRPEDVRLEQIPNWNKRAMLLQAHCGPCTPLKRELIKRFKEIKLDKEDIEVLEKLQDEVDNTLFIKKVEEIYRRYQDERGMPSIREINQIITILWDIQSRINSGNFKIDKPKISSLELEADYPKHPDAVIVKPNEFYREGLAESAVWSWYDKVKFKIVKSLRDGIVLIEKVIDGTIIQRNDPKTGEKIKIESVEDFERQNNGRNIGFHKVVKKNVDYIFVDLDPRDEFPWKKVKEVAKVVENVISKLPEVKSTKILFSGSRGFYIFGYLKLSINVDKARDIVREALDRGVTSKFENVTTKLTKALNSMRLDITTLHEDGSLRTEYSLHPKTGLVCLDISKINKPFENLEKSDFTISKILKRTPISSLDTEADVDLRHLAPAVVLPFVGPSVLPPLQERPPIVEEIAPVGWHHYEHLVQEAASKHKVPFDMLMRLLRTENSSGNPNAVNPSSGATGLAQFIPPTANYLGINPLDPSSSIDGAAKYLRKLYHQFNNWEDAVKAYNWGPGNVEKALAEEKELPQETQKYLKKVFPERRSSMTLIAAADRFNDIIKKIKASADKLGVKAFATGGFVRDELLGREPKDLDVMVEGENAGIRLAEQIAKDYNLHAPIIFPRFGTARIEIDGEEVEFVAPRKEYYTEESRKPEVEIGSLDQDAMRRDFSINALFKDLNTGKILDLTGHGLKDLKDKIIRVTDTENADVIFSQDPLRMLRAIRQSLALGFAIDSLTKEAITRNVERLKIISAERIRDEFSKIITGPNATDGIKMLQELGLTKQFFPEWEAAVGITQETLHHNLTVDQHILEVLNNVPSDLVLRLAALLHDISKPAAKTIVDEVAHFYKHEEMGAETAEKILRRLKFPNDIIEQVKIVVGEHMRPHHYTKDWADKTVRKLMRDLGPHLQNVLQLAEADIKGGNPEKQKEKLEQLEDLRQRVKEQERAPIKPQEIKPLIDGNELQQIFSKGPGKWIGDVQEFQIDKQLENPNLTKEEMVSLIKEFMQSYKASQLLSVIELEADYFKYDPNSTKNEGRWRLVDPAEFDEGSFRRWRSWAGVEAPAGISFLVGEVRGKKSLQAIRFDKNLWKEEAARDFWNSVKHKPGFKRTWSWKEIKASLMVEAETAVYEILDSDLPVKEKIKKLVAIKAYEEALNLLKANNIRAPKLLEQLQDLSRKHKIIGLDDAKKVLQRGTTSAKINALDWLDNANEINLIYEGTKSNEYIVARHAVDLLQKHKDIIDLNKVFNNNESSLIRIRAFTSLINLGQTDHVEKALKDSEESVRSFAFTYLLNKEDKDTILRFIDNEPSDDIRLNIYKTAIYQKGWEEFIGKMRQDPSEKIKKFVKGERGEERELLTPEEIKVKHEEWASEPKKEIQKTPEILDPQKEVKTPKGEERIRQHKEILQKHEEWLINQVKEYFEKTERKILNLQEANKEANNQLEQLEKTQPDAIKKIEKIKKEIEERMSQLTVLQRGLAEAKSNPEKLKEEIKKDWERRVFPISSLELESIMPPTTFRGPSSQPWGSETATPIAPRDYDLLLKDVRQYYDYPHSKFRNLLNLIVEFFKKKPLSENEIEEEKSDGV